MLAGIVKRHFSLALLVCALGCDGPPPSRSADPAPTPPTPVSAASAPATPPPPLAEPPPAARPKAGALHYVERILGDAQPDEPLPMIVAIHGLGDDPDNFTHLFDGFAGSARLILPQGVDATDDGGWSWFPGRARSADVEGLATGIRSSADKLAAAITELREQRPTSGDPIVTGFSQGGMLTFALAVRHPEVVGYAVPVGGWLPPPLWPEQGPQAAHPPVVALHGTADNAVRFEPTQAGVEALKAKGYNVTLKSYEGVRHAIPPEIRTDLYDLLDDAVRRAKADAR